MASAELVPALEALLFASDTPLTLTQLVEATDADPADVSEALLALQTAADDGGRGVRLAEMAGGWVFLTRDAYAPFIGRMLRGKKKMRLSRPALETLAIIAYKQPVTKAEVDAIRGVDSSGVLNTLLERELVTIRGRSKVVGRPLLYGTTTEFLSYFGLKDLNELPRVEELKAIVGEREPENPEAEPDLFPVASLAATGDEVAADGTAPAGLPEDPADYAFHSDAGAITPDAPSELPEDDEAPATLDDRG